MQTINVEVSSGVTLFNTYKIQQCFQHNMIGWALLIHGGISRPPWETRNEWFESYGILQVKDAVKQTI